MKQQMNMFQKKAQDENPEEELSEVEIGTWERVQRNDYKDDQRTLEENECTEQEVRSFLKKS